MERLRSSHNVSYSRNVIPDGAPAPGTRRIIAQDAEFVRRAKPRVLLVPSAETPETVRLVGTTLRGGGEDVWPRFIGLLLVFIYAIFAMTLYILPPRA